MLKIKNEGSVSLLSAKKENVWMKGISFALVVAMLFVSLPIQPLSAAPDLLGGGSSNPAISPEDAAKREKQFKPVPKADDPDAPLSPASESDPQDTETAERFAEDLDLIRPEYAAAAVTGRLTYSQFVALINASKNEKSEIYVGVTNKGYSHFASSGNQDSVMSTVANVGVFKNNTFSLHTHVDAATLPSLDDLNFYKQTRAARQAAGITSTLYQYLVDSKGIVRRYYLTSSDRLVVTQISMSSLYTAYIAAVKAPTNQAEVEARKALNAFIAAEQNKVNNKVKYGSEIVKMLSDGPTNVTEIVSSPNLTRLGFSLAQQQDNAYVNSQFATALGLPSNATFNQIFTAMQQQHSITFPNGVTLVGGSQTLTPAFPEPIVEGDPTNPFTTINFPQGDTASAQLVYEYSYFKSTTTFGWYEVNPDNTVTKHPIFQGSAVVGNKLDITYPAGKQIGFYITTPLDTFYTEPSRNADGADHFYVRRNADLSILTINWEDLPDPTSSYYLLNKTKYETYPGGPFRPDFDKNDGGVTFFTPNGNEAPIQDPTPVITPEDTPKHFTIATDPNGDKLDVFVTQDVQHGIVICDDTVPGVVTCDYTPDPDYNGPDSFNVTVIDPQGAQISFVQQITVTPVNDPPVAQNKSTETLKNTPVDIQLQGNDPIEGTVVTYHVNTQPSHGTVNCNVTTGLCTYTPSNGYVGPDTFTYYVTDTDSNPLNSNIATVTITINEPANQPPAAQNVVKTTPEDTPISFPLSGSDPDGNPIVYTLTGVIPTGLVCDAAGQCTYTPPANFTGVVNATYTVTDNGNLVSNVATITITVTPVNDPPAAQPVVKTTPEDTPITFSLVGSDPEGDSLTYQLTGTIPTGLVCNSSGSCTYTPPANFNGVVNATYTVNDGQLTSPVAPITITVTPLNDAPAANPQTVTTPEDTPKNITLTGSDPDGNPITFIIVTPPSHGTLVCNGADCVYTPDPNYTGPDSFTFKTNDGLVDSPIATVTITVTPVNDPPAAQPVVKTTPEDTPITFSLVGTDPEGNSLTYQLTGTIPTGLVCNASGSCTYTPPANFTGVVNATYTVNDGQLTSPVAPITITVTPVNDPPAAQPVVKTTPEDTPITFSLVGSDPEGDSLTYQLTGTIPTGLVCNANGSCTYTPPANFTGVVNATYTVNDGQLTSPVAPITITVTPLNDPPIAQDVNKTTNKNTPITFNLIGSDPVEGDPLTYVKLTNPANGSVTCNASTGVCTYTPNTNFVGTDSFTYRVTDPALSNIATVTITVLNPLPNQPPVADPQSVTTPEDTPITFTLTGSDPDGDPINFTSFTQPSHGSVSCDPFTGVCTYTPFHNYNGPDSFTFKTFDGTNESAVAIVTINVTPVTDGPQAHPQTVTTPQDTPLPITLGGADPDGDPLTYIIVTPPSHGTVTCVGPNCTYTPDPGYVGPDSFTFKVNDGTTDSPAAEVKIDVTPVQITNRPPFNTPILLQDHVNPQDFSNNRPGIQFDLNDFSGDYDSLPYSNFNDVVHWEFDTPIPAGHKLECNAAQPQQNVNGLCLYTPPVGFQGSLFLTNYRIVDKYGETSGWKSITVKIGEAPKASPVQLEGPANQSIQFDLKNYSSDHPDTNFGDVLTYSLLPGLPAGHSLTCNASTGLCTYTPPQGFVGSVNLTNYKVTDAANQSAQALISVTITNAAPVANNQSVTTVEGTPKQITLTGSDADGNALTYAIVGQPVHGTLVCVGANCTYTPASGFSGTDTFTYKVNDGFANSNVATVTITVTPANRPPSIKPIRVEVEEGKSVTFDLLGTDPEGDKLWYELQLMHNDNTIAHDLHCDGEPLGGQGTSSVTGKCTFSPSLDPWGNPSSQLGTHYTYYRARDAQGNVSELALLEYVILPTTDRAPVAVSQTINAVAGEKITFQLQATDPDGDPIVRYGINAQNVDGDLSCNLDTGVCEYTPFDGWTGCVMRAFTFNASDGLLYSRQGWIQINIDPKPSAASLKDLYQMLLKRDPSTTEVNNWLAANLTYKQIQTQLKASNEFYIVEKYNALLGRLLTSAERSNWVTKLNTGTGSKLDLVKTIVRSTEYRDLKNASGVKRTNSEFVAALYRDLLGRDGSASELDSWVRKLNLNQRTRLQVVDSFLSSSEFLNRVALGLI